jgi:hypothetical protein
MQCQEVGTDLRPSVGRGDCPVGGGAPEQDHGIAPAAVTALHRSPAA